MRRYLCILILLAMFSGCQSDLGEVSSADTSLSSEEPASDIPSSEMMRLEESSSDISSSEIQSSAEGKSSSDEQLVDENASHEATSTEAVPESENASSSPILTSSGFIDVAKLTPEERNELENPFRYYIDDYMDMDAYGGMGYSEIGLIIYCKDQKRVQEIIAGYEGPFFEIEYRDTEYSINDLIKIDEEINKVLTTMTEFPSTQIVENHVQVLLFGEWPEYQEFKKFLLSYPEKKKVVLKDAGKLVLPAT